MSNIFQELKQTVTNFGEESTGVTTYEVCKEIRNLTAGITSRLVPEYPTGYGKYELKCVNGVVQWVDVTVYPTALCFTANTAGSTISLGYGKGTPNTSYEYTTDGETWNEYTIGDTITIAKPGYKVYFRGNNSNVVFSDSSYMMFAMTGSIASSGNIMSILDSTEQSTTVQNYAFYNLFKSCKALTVAPELPATTLGNYCYDGMFRACSSLTTAPALPATTLAANCYQYMFNGCTSLTTAPALPATTLADYCYDHIFHRCTSLTTAPELPATTLANGCYYGMFGYCTSLTTAPELSVTTLVDGCYMWMFNSCTNLNYIKCLATDISASYCLTNWVNGVAASGTFVKNPSMTSWTTGTSGIPENWTVEDAQ